MGFGKTKCIFNNTYFMNATIMADNILKCDSPPLPAGAAAASIDGKAPFYNISISLNGKEMVSTELNFTYYIDPTIDSISPNLGPLTGGTVSKISGKGFAQDGVCNLTVRYGPIT